MICLKKWEYYKNYRNGFWTSLKSNLFFFYFYSIFPLGALQLNPAAFEMCLTFCEWTCFPFSLDFSAAMWEALMEGLFLLFWTIRCLSRSFYILGRPVETFNSTRYSILYLRITSATVLLLPPNISPIVPTLNPFS